MRVFFLAKGKRMELSVERELEEREGPWNQTVKSFVKP